MLIAAVGINHKTAPVEIRERVSVLRDEVPQALGHLKRHVLEGAILSTCNRTEVYAIVQDSREGAEALKRFLVEYAELPRDTLMPFLYAHAQEDAARHLFAVASGIDSQILGETEILGQVGDALLLAADAGSVDVPLSRLFHWAMHVGRQVRERTTISRHTVSVSSAGVQMARQVFGGLAGCRVLVISAGEAGKLVAQSLRDAGAREIGVANRTRFKAEALAVDLGGRAVDFDRIPEALVDFDIVISATASTKYVLRKETIASAMEARAGRPLCLIDIAVPRDIDPESRTIRNVHLYDIDDLEAVSLTGIRERQKAVAQVERIVDAETQRFMLWFLSLDAVPVVRQLHRKAEAIREQELARTLGKLQHLNASDRRHVEAMSRAIVKKLLHDPIDALKASGEHGRHIDAARDLFRLLPEAAPEAGKPFEPID